MKKFLFIAVSFLLLLFTACEDNGRPNTGDEFSFKITGHSILKNAEVSILDGDGKEIKTGATDENGEFIIEKVESATSLLVKVCKGTFLNASLESEVDFSGCLENSITATDGDVSLSVNILSTFISKYNSETSMDEWKTYLDVSSLPIPELQSSLTDSTKNYLFHQGLMKIAENVSKAGSKTPETTYSTETLLNLLVEDLADDDIINGSTAKKFGGLDVNADIMKSVLADTIPEISGSFTSDDLQTWLDTIRNSNVKFLGGSGGAIDKDKPVITINSPESDSVVFGTVTVEATATDNEAVQSLTCEILEKTTADETVQIEDTDDTAETFSGSFDSSLFDDSTITLKCTASDGNNVTEKEISLTVSNNNKVTLKAYITNELTGWERVTIYSILEDGTADTKVKTLDSDDFSGSDGDDINFMLSPGTYRVVIKGGEYIPVFLGTSETPEDNRISFDSTLETRGTVKAGEDSIFIATPLTTLREYLSAALHATLHENEDSEAETKSFELISEHIDSDFPLYIEPISKPQLTENSKNYIVLAGLERLAVLVGERHDPALEAGAITIEQVLKALTDDLENPTQSVLDGGGTVNQFAVDSYFFRYWYAIAVKMFLESDKNLTGLGFSDLQTVINNISMDDSELFPDDEAPKRVTDQPPVISDKQFKRSFETEFQTYSVDNIIYSNADVFSVKFKALPDVAGDLFIDSVSISGDVNVQSLTDINVDGNYTAELLFPAIEDGEKTVLITVIDNAENTGTATLQAVKDTVKPVIDKFELLRNEEALTGEYTTVPFTADYEVTETNFRNVQLAVRTASSSTAFSYDKEVGTSLIGEFQISKTDLPGDGDDGDYSFSVKFTDKAGNETTTEFQKTIDTVKPEIQLIEMTPAINENGFIDSREITVEITATDNIEQILNYWRRRNETSYDKNANDPPNVFNISEPEDATITYHFKVSDQAGNETPESDAFSFTIDTVDPVVNITNSADLEGKTFKSTSGSLVLNYTIEEINRDRCELRINGTKYKDIIDFPTSTLTITGSELLDPEKGPAEMNTASIYCIDLAGRETETTVSFYIDDEYPVILIDPDQFGGSVIDNDYVVLDSLISDNFGREGNLDIKFKYVDNAFNSIGYQNENTWPISGLEDIFWASSAGGRASCSPSDDSCEFWIPNRDDDYFNTAVPYEKLYDNLNNFTFFVEATDKAGNKTEESFTYTVDKEPVPMLSGGFLYDDGKIYLGFSSQKKIYDFKMRVNGSWSTPECYHNYFDGLDTHYYSCPFNANTGTTYDVKISSMDSFGNWTFSNCSAFQDTNNNYCFTGNITANLPELSIIVSNQTNTSVNYDISSDSTIIDCEILKDGSHFQDCDKSTGSFSEDISTWDDGRYTITATAKNPIGAETTRSVDFFIDNTITSFHLEIDNYKEIYYNSAPTLHVSASIAGGVDKVHIYLSRHKQHRSRSSYPQCSGTYCYSTPNTKIAELQAGSICNPLNGTCSTYILPYTPSPDLFEPGYYDQVYWAIESKRNGESESGYFPLNEPIRIAKASSDYAQMVSININEDNEELEVKFRPSVFSTADTSSSADLDFYVLNNPDISESNPYHEICGDNNTSTGFKKQYMHYENKLKVSFDRLTWSSSAKVYTAFFKPNLDSYRYAHNVPNSSNYYAFASCSSDENCPVGSEDYELSLGCNFIYPDDWEGTPGPSVCEPNYTKHHPADNDISHLNICLSSDPNTGTCTKYADSCPNPYSYPNFYIMWTGVGFGYHVLCPLLRDYWFFPKDLKIKGVDDFNKPATATLSTGYTSWNDCPQYKELDNFD